MIKDTLKKAEKRGDDQPIGAFFAVMNHGGGHCCGPGRGGPRGPGLIDKAPSAVAKLKGQGGPVSALAVGETSKRRSRLA